MLELCNILGVSVNELLNGEKIDIKDHEKKTNELLLEMAKQEEKQNKRIMMDMWVLVITVGILYIGIVTLAYHTIKDESTLQIVIPSATLVLAAACFYALKLEVEAGYYECENCHHKFKPSYLIAMITTHAGNTRCFKCPECANRTWCKKVMSK